MKSPPRGKGMLALLGAVVLIIAGLLGSAVVASAAVPSKKWKFDLVTTDSGRGGQADGTVIYKKSGKCYNGEVHAGLSDRNASDKHGAILVVTFVDCKTKKVKTTKIKTTAKVRVAALTQFYKNARDVRVLLCLYQGKDETRFCNTKVAV
ncbi:hypothetical protein AB0J86_11920 [Micromonospora sp. NPDC049559]|uniref:hypothetical protein n=1 Tax=Micromonospora sp. NPDC049559 TaxID=3155923 RepID=UPI0034284D5A